MSQPRILIVHPEPASLALLSSMLRSLGHAIDEAANDRVAVRQMERGGVDMVLAVADPADPEALELLTCVRRKHRHVPVILLFPTVNPERAREALRLGALSVLRYPVPAGELRAAVTQALGTIRRPESEPAAHSHPSAVAGLPCLGGVGPAVGDGQAVPNGQPHPDQRGASLVAFTASPTRGERAAREAGLVGTDPSFRLAVEMAATVAPTRTPVLIVGERGTGKALLARTVHALGSRPDQPFVSVDCAALTEATLGHDRPDGPGLIPFAAPHEPAFDWAGQLAEARGGTLFLKGVAALSDGLQFLLLRALQERDPDVRILMSTGENLVPLVEQGAFRQDLYHRASVFSLKLPPLRHRAGDIEPLAEHFRARSSHECGKHVVGFTRDAMEILVKQDWPGNVRELEGVVQRGVALCQGTRITSGHLSPSLTHARPPRTSALSARSSSTLSIRPLKEALEEPEKRIIIQALQALNWNRQETARVLDINRTTLYKKMKKYGLLVDEPAWVN